MDRAWAAPNELGRPILRHYTPGEHLRGRESRVMIQDHTGVVYFANGDHLISFDGFRWSFVKLPSESGGVLQFAKTEDGTIYLGGIGVMGYLRGTGDAVEFVSLREQLPPAGQQIDIIQAVAAVGDTVGFADDTNLYLWRGGRFTVVPFPTPTHSHGERLFGGEKTLYVTGLGYGLGRVVADQVELISDDVVLRENQVVLVHEELDGSCQFLTAESGLYELRDGRVTAVKTELNRWVRGKRIFRAMRLRDGSCAVGFSAVSGDGGMRFAADGSYLGPLDTSMGLLVKTVRGFREDTEGGLWIGTEAGAARLEWPSPITIFDVVNGLGQGEVMDVARHDDGLYAATTEGLFRLYPGDESGRAAHFERVLNRAVTAVVSHPEGMLVLARGGVQRMGPTGLELLVELPKETGALRKSRIDPNRVWIGTAEGVRSLRWRETGWAEETPVVGLEVSVRNLDETAEGKLWVESVEGQVYQLSFAPGRVASPQIEKWASLISVPETVNMPRGWASAALNLPQRVTATIGKVGRSWLEATSEGQVRWVCGARGLARIDLERSWPPSTPFAVYLTAPGLIEGTRLPPKPPTLEFNFVAPRQRATSAVEYRTRLAGLEEEWTAWSAKRARNFVRLPSGRYRFEVQARDAEGVMTEEASLGFVVQPEWWAAWWAILGYISAGGGLVLAVAELRTRTLRRQTEQLEAVVAERTHQLAQHAQELDRQNHELVRLNQLELDDKIAARLAEEKARLEVLRYQLNPHFLFNTLASISASLPAGISTAREMLERLGDFCRLTLYRGDDQEWTTLDHEVQLLRAYLEIEQSRWGDLLEVEIAIDPSLGKMPLPHFLLLPLLENALKYGRETSEDRVGIRVGVRRHAIDPAILFEVANTGEWIVPQVRRSVPSLGIGLENLRERLARYYPQTHQLEITAQGGWVVVVLKISEITE